MGKLGRLLGLVMLWPAFAAAQISPGPGITTVTDGTNTATGTVRLYFTSGATVTPSVGGTVDVAVAGAGSGCTVAGAQYQLLAVNAAGTGCDSDASATVNAGALTLGASGTLGSVTLGNATSGTVTVQPVTGALGSVTASFPANSGTVAELNLGQTWTAAQTIPGITSTGNFNTTGVFGATIGNTSTSNGLVMAPIASGSTFLIKNSGPSGVAQPMTIETGINGTPATLTLLTNNGAFTVNAGTGAMTLNGGGLSMNQNLSQAMTYVYSGSSSTAVAANLFQFITPQVSGFPNDGGTPALGLIHVLSSTTGTGDFGYEVWEHYVTGFGSKVGFEAAIDNAGYVQQSPDTWATATPYVAGKVVSVGYNVMHTNSAGTSGAVTPTCSTTISSCSDGTLTWHFDGALGTFTQMVGVFGKAIATTSFSSSSSALIGNVFGSNTQAAANAANMVSVIGSEPDFGASFPVLSRVGEQIVVRSDGTQQGAIDDVGWRLGLQTGGAPLLYGMAIGNRTNQPIIDPNGYIFRVWTTGGGLSVPSVMAMAGAFDLADANTNGSGTTGGGFLFRGPNSQLLGSGDIQSNYALLHVTGTGASLDASEYQVSSITATPVSGGTGWVASGKYADCTSGSSGANDKTLVSIGGVSGGSVTSAVLVRGGFGSTNAVTTETCTSQQQVGAIDGAGNPTMPTTPFTITVTWSRANGGAPVLALGSVADAIVGVQAAMSTSATIGFLGMPFSNGTPTGVPTNNALGALTEINATSKNLNIYIPGVGWYHAALTVGAS